jgi:hypothetical protein
MDYNPGDMNVTYLIYGTNPNDKLYYDIIIFPNATNPSYLCYINVTSLSLWNALCGITLNDCNDRSFWTYGDGKSNMLVINDTNFNNSIGFFNCNTTYNYSISYKTNL